MLEQLFKQYPGYVQVRLFVDKHLAFVEYGSEGEAEVALKGLRGFRMSPTYELVADYAK